MPLFRGIIVFNRRRNSRNRNNSLFHPCSWPTSKTGTVSPKEMILFSTSSKLLRLLFLFISYKPRRHKARKGTKQAYPHRHQ